MHCPTWDDTLLPRSVTGADPETGPAGKPEPGYGHSGLTNVVAMDYPADGRDLAPRSRSGRRAYEPVEGPQGSR